MPLLDFLGYSLFFKRYQRRDILTRDQLLEPTRPNRRRERTNIPPEKDTGTVGQHERERDRRDVVAHYQREKENERGGRGRGESIISDYIRQVLKTMAMISRWYRHRHCVPRKPFTHRGAAILSLNRRHRFCCGDDTHRRYEGINLPTNPGGVRASAVVTILIGDTCQSFGCGDDTYRRYVGINLPTNPGGMGRQLQPQGYELRVWCLFLFLEEAKEVTRGDKIHAHNIKVGIKFFRVRPPRSNLKLGRYHCAKREREVGEVGGGLGGKGGSRHPRFLLTVSYASQGVRQIYVSVIIPLTSPDPCYVVCRNTTRPRQAA
ncbi:hypothetical protein J6590_034010, partial [Homalodisca vitripennis]